MPFYVMKDLARIYYAKSATVDRDPNEVITTSIADVIEDAVENNQMDNLVGVFAYQNEILRGSLNNNISYGIVAGQWPKMFHPD